MFRGFREFFTGIMGERKFCLNAHLFLASRYVNNIMEEKTSEIKTSKVRGDSLKRSVIY